MENDLLSLYLYFGISVGSSDLGAADESKYHDLEKFFLDNTIYLHSSRSLEGFLVWLKKYGFLLSPSKIRRMLKLKYNHYSPAVGAFLNFIEKYHSVNFDIVTSLCKVEKTKKSFIQNVPLSIMKNRNALFESWGLVIPNFELSESKYLLTNDQIMKKCPELKNRIIMGSVLHSDLYSYLDKCVDKKILTKYQIAKDIFNLRGSVGKAAIMVLEG